VARVAVTQCDQEVAETLFQVLGHRSLEGAVSRAGQESPEGRVAPYGAVEDHWRYAQAATVASGAIEIQRMLIARSILGNHGSGAS
jgi:alkylation response protein AidB-like acyl-CoA dehydrogenase